MKFSIIIPTHNRPELLAVVVKHAMQVDYPLFEVIVSDNSSEEQTKRSNDEVVSEYVGRDNFKFVRPPQLLSPPEHFEFALEFASGDYVLYLTDKMLILPHILSLAAEAISISGAEIVNWAPAPYQIDDVKYPSGSGTLTESSDFLYGRPETYNPQVALKFKASCIVPRNKQQTRDYVIGKIIFGCYSKELINRIRDKSGTVFNGATHDYSAMIQALSLADSCVMLNTYGAVFISLPLDQSWGSLINTYAQQALNYYKTFANADDVLSSLMVPGLYASQHNMVAHDYKKFMPLYGNAMLFNELNWLLAIQNDLVSESKVWRDSVERDEQFELFSNQVKTKGMRFPLHMARLRENLVARYGEVPSRITARFTGQSPRPKFEYRAFHMDSLGETVQHILTSSRAAKKNRILCLYNASQTYTETVFENLDAFRLHSIYQWNYLHWKHLKRAGIDLNDFDAIVIHYTVRLPFDEIAEVAGLLAGYLGLKILFIQDEYDNTNLTKHWIKTIGFDLVFSVVPKQSLHSIYKPEEFPLSRFVSVLTGYIPSSLMRHVVTDFIPPSRRSLVIGYRARPLPIRYGVLGQEKVSIGKIVKDYCLLHHIPQDIAWSEESRIYGGQWYQFITSCKAMLGSESGSNVFDWDGTLTQLIDTFREKHPSATEQDIYRELIAPREVPQLMNQVSPRIFEAIACRTVLVLFEGNYSGVIKPWIHFIPLKKDGSNLDEVFAKLQDDNFVDEMANRAYEDIIASGGYGYVDFVRMVDVEITSELLNKNRQPTSRWLTKVDFGNAQTLITTSPLRFNKAWWEKGILLKLWASIPFSLKKRLKPTMKNFLNIRDNV